MHPRLLFVLVLVAGAYAASNEERDCCSQEDKKEIQWIWHRVWQSTNTERKIRVMRAVVDDLLEHHPELKDDLEAKGVTEEDTPTARAYMVRLVHQFDNIINLLDDPLVLQEQLEFLRKQYGQKEGMKKTYFEALAESLERVLPDVSSCFPAAAWKRCLDRLADIVSQDIEDD